jgi:hypothetical protein
VDILTADYDPNGALRGVLVRFWSDGPLYWWRVDGTLHPFPNDDVDLSSWEAHCAHLRYVEGLDPGTIALRTGRSSTAVNSALNRARAKADARWLTFSEVAERLRESA